MFTLTKEEKNALIAKYAGRSLKDLRPDLAAEWHPTKNGELTPEMVGIGTKKKIWWFLPYNDKETGRRFDFEWTASVPERTRGDGCPFISGHRVWRGFNDLATLNPRLAAEWHPEKNGDLTPQDVTPISGRKVWWLLPYYDTETDRHFAFEWQSTISHRADGDGCPFISGRAVYRGFNDLATVYPELAKEWNFPKNGDLDPRDILATSTKSVWWSMPYTDPRTGKCFNFEWKACIRDRVRGRGCPVLCGKAVHVGFNDLATTHPGLASEWHPHKNGMLTPRDVTAGSAKNVWWMLSYDDAKTGKHFDFEWQSPVRIRAKGVGCPVLSGHAVWRGFNDLATVNPRIAKQWHPTKNQIEPHCVTFGTCKKVWWKCDNGHEWLASVSSRTRGTGCPYCCESHGETRISQFCERYNIVSRSQYKFDDCVHQRPLPFDRALFYKNGDLACLVEYDGIQHFEPVDFSGNGSAEVEFRCVKLRDAVKNLYCRENKLPLIRIPYWDYDNIDQILLKKMVRYGLLR